MAIPSLRLPPQQAKNACWNSGCGFTPAFGRAETHPSAKARTDGVPGGKYINPLELLVVLKRAIQSFRPLGSTPACGSEVDVFDANVYLGLRPRLVYVGPLALGFGMGRIELMPVDALVKL